MSLSRPKTEPDADFEPLYTNRQIIVMAYWCRAKVRLPVIKLRSSHALHLQVVVATQPLPRDGGMEPQKSGNYPGAGLESPKSKRRKKSVAEQCTMR